MIRQTVAMYTMNIFWRVICCFEVDLRKKADRQTQKVLSDIGIKYINYKWVEHCNCIAKKVI